MFHDDKGVEESSHQLTTIQIHRKKTIAHHEKISTVTFPERHYLYYRRHPHSTTPKTETKNVTMINACQLPPLERPFSVPAIKMNRSRPQNFRVRVYRNGDDSMCAYCASCTMNIILTDATRKLQMIRLAQRLFDCNGHEIFRSEDIHRDMEYYVSEGEDFISPLEAIKSMIKYRQHSKWTIDGIESSYIIKRQPRRRRRRFTSVDNPIPPYYEEKLLIYHEDKGTQAGGNISFDHKDTQTITKCENKYIQTDRKVLVDDKNTQTTTKCENKDMQTDGKISLENKDTQTIVKLEHKDMQTDGKTLLESKDTQTIIKLEHKDIQTDGKTSLENKDTQTATKYEDREVQTDIWISPPPLRDNEVNATTANYYDITIPLGSDQMDSNPPKKGEREPDGMGPNPSEKDERKTDGIVRNPPEEGEREPNRREPDGMGPNPSEKDERKTDVIVRNPPEEGEREPNRREPDGMGPNPPENDERKTGGIVRNPPKKDSEREFNQKEVDRPRSGQTTPVSPLLDAVYRRSTPTTNFRVKVYRNGEHNRYAYCKSCSMDIILSSATQKLQMPIPARRLFDPDGVEIFDSKDIRRDSEYYVSSGGNFKKPLN